jgi:hypothetical protein
VQQLKHWWATMPNGFLKTACSRALKYGLSVQCNLVDVAYEASTLLIRACDVTVPCEIILLQGKCRVQTSQEPCLMQAMILCDDAGVHSWLSTCTDTKSPEACKSRNCIQYLSRHFSAKNCARLLISIMCYFACTYIFQSCTCQTL